MIRILTGERQIGRLSTRMVEELDLGIPRPTPARGQSGISTREDRIEIQRPEPLGHPASSKTKIAIELQNCKRNDLKVMNLVVH